jgi:AcrR family transcriptional regulator
MARSYTLKRRAEQQAETRRRLAEAAMELHGTVGPARTSLSLVAERAGVQRNTLYAHFPDERSLFQACSALFIERHPPPDPAAWSAAGNRAARLRAGLCAIYGWYGDNAELMGCVLRDAEHHALTRETTEAQLGPLVGAWRAVLGEGLSPAQQPLLHLALSFHSWRALVREAGLDAPAAAEAMARAIEGAG